jgi:DnaJ-domain-containing protein 1
LEEEARLQQEEDARREDARRQDEAVERSEGEEHQPGAEQTQNTSAPDAMAAAPVEEAFDPYAILGVPRDATKAQISAAYREGMAKYDPATVSHLGDDVQAHFKAKAQAVERAYQSLGI